MVTYFPKPLNKQVAAISDSLIRTQEGLGIGASGDTHDAIGSGQFVYVRDHSSLAEGLYKSTEAIAANGALSTSNLTADESGGLNDLQGQVTLLNDKFIVGEATTVASYSALQSALSAKVATMDAYSFENMVIALSATFTEFPNGGNYGVQIYKAASNNIFSAIFQGYNDEVKFIRYKNGTWTCSNIALDSKFTWTQIYGDSIAKDTETTVTIPSTAHEVLVGYGSANSEQSYGGSIIHFPIGVNKPCFLPVYTSTSGNMSGMVYVFLNGRTLILRNYTVSGTGATASSGARFFVYAR